MRRWATGAQAALGPGPRDSNEPLEKTPSPNRKQGYTGSPRRSVCPSSASHGSWEFQEIIVTHRALTPDIKGAPPPALLQEQVLALRQCADARGRALPSPSQPSRLGSQNG